MDVMIKMPRMSLMCGYVAMHKDPDLSRYRLFYMRWSENMELVHIPTRGALVLTLEAAS
jgi:hypothetical protein